MSQPHFQSQAPNAAQVPLPDDWVPAVFFPDEPRASLRFDAGILCCGQIREYLESVAFEYPQIRFREGRGWFSRAWVVIGPMSRLREIEAALTAWVKGCDP